MNTTELQPFYPDFVPNQILTNTQLNQLRTYLDEQTRLSRIRLVGRGIVCGLTFRVRPDGPNREVIIAEGYGITSDGYLIDLGAEPASNGTPVTEVIYSGVRDYTDPFVDDSGAPLYEPWQDVADPTRQISLFELIPASVMAGTDPPDDAELLTQALLNDRVLVLYLEADAEELKSCLVTDCDNKGLNVRLNVRALLVPEAALNPWDSCGTRLTDRLRIPRFHAELRAGGPPDTLPEIDETSDINAVYGRLVKQARDPLTDALRTVFDAYGTFLDLDGPRTETAVDRLDTLFDAAQPDDAFNQYHYGFARDLATAYNEFLACACALVTDCCPADDFPRHLMLGGLDADAEGFRHTFAASPVRNVMHDDLEKARALYDRILILIQRFDPGLATDIRITPSQTDLFPLGTRAVPYFYGLEANVRTGWQPRLCCTTDPLWSYHTPHGGNGIAHALDVDYTTASLLRIEGHLGETCTQAEEQIQLLKRRHNVEFDLLSLHLQPAPDDAFDLDLLEELDRLHAELWDRVRNGEPAEEVLEALSDVHDLKRALYDRNREWISTRLRRLPYCDTAYLQADYLAHRNALLCEYQGLFDQEAVWTELANHFAVFDQPNAIPLMQQQFLLSAGLMRDDLHDLMHVLLPKDLHSFNYLLFARTHKRAVGHLVVMRLTLTVLLVTVLTEHDNASVEMQAAIRFLAQPAVQDVIARVFTLTRDCRMAELLALYYTLEHIRANDLGLFRHFADRYPGLEHRAGVEPGGTFVLVCDEAQDSDGLVVADFSLNGQAHCCCAVDTTGLCFPPIALPDYHLVIFEPDEEPPFELLIRARANDVEFNADSEGEFDPNFESRLNIDLPSDRSELDAELSLEEDGVIRYRIEEPRPMAIDRFTYILKEDSECGGDDVGLVVVLFVPATRDADVQSGRIVGSVRMVTGAPIPGATVRVQQTNQATVTDATGGFTFPNLAPGTETVSAAAGGFQPATQTVSVGEGQTATVDFTLVRVGLVQLINVTRMDGNLTIFRGNRQVAVVQPLRGTPFFDMPAVDPFQVRFGNEVLLQQPVNMAESQDHIVLIGDVNFSNQLRLLIRPGARRESTAADQVQFFFANSAQGSALTLQRFADGTSGARVNVAVQVPPGEVRDYTQIPAFVQDFAFTGVNLAFRFDLRTLRGQTLALVAFSTERNQPPTLVAFDANGNRIQPQVLPIVQ